MQISHTQAIRVFQALGLRAERWTLAKLKKRTNNIHKHVADDTTTGDEQLDQVMDALVERAMAGETIELVNDPPSAEEHFQREAFEQQIDRADETASMEPPPEEEHRKPGRQRVIEGSELYVAGAALAATLALDSKRTPQNTWEWFRERYGGANDSRTGFMGQARRAVRGYLGLGHDGPRPSRHYIIGELMKSGEKPGIDTWAEVDNRYGKVNPSASKTAWKEAEAAIAGYQSEMDE